MTLGIILPHTKNYKLKTVVPLIKKQGATILNIQETQLLPVEYDFFLQNGMKNIQTPAEYLKNFIFSENTPMPILIHESPALRMLPNSSKVWKKFVWNSIFMDEGICPFDPTFNRWELLSRQYNIVVKEYKRRGESILFNLQMPFDAALNRLTFSGVDYLTWCLQTIHNIKKISDRPIIIRSHPFDKSAEEFLKKNLKINNIEYSADTNFYNDLNRSWCMISYNSTSSVESVINGTHTICLDSSAIAWDVSGHSINDIETNLEFDRDLWLKKVAYMQWNIDELNDSYAWSLIKSCVWK